MIEVNNVSKIYGNEYILKDVSFVINKTDKVGIVGPNGAGKSTLLKCIIEDDFISEGEVNIQGSIGYIEQNKLLDDEKTLWNQYLSVFPNLYNLYKLLQEEVKGKEDLDKYIKVEDKFSLQGGYDFKVKVDKLLTGFGFEKEDIKREVSSFSGGEKTKLSLIKLLLLEPDYLVLDEPTNHLDLSAIVWLEKYLKSLKKSIVLVSHDEIFLNNICDKIIAVENKGAKVYKTRFNNYVKQKEFDFDLEMKTYLKQKALIKKYEEFIAKNKEKPTKIGQVNDRKNKLEKLKLLEEPVKVLNKLDFEFESYHLKKSAYLDYHNVDLGYDGNVIIKNINLKVYGGEKIAIIGKNGVGKSTFLKSILDFKKLSGKIKVPSNIKIGYFDQEQKTIDVTKTLYDLIYDTHEFDSQSAIRRYLGKFGFKRDDVFKKFDDLSGGQRVRVNLALMALECYDILLLDEPTNHLDINMSNVLINTLKKFPSTLVFITHDRKLINEVATKILYFQEDGVSEFEGNWDEYVNDIKEKKQKVLKEQLIVKDESSSENKSVPSKKINKQKLAKIEEKIIEKEEVQKDLVDKMQEDTIIKDYKKMQKINEELTLVRDEINKLYEEYDNIFN